MVDEAKFEPTPEELALTPQDLQLLDDVEIADGDYWQANVQDEAADSVDKLFNLALLDSREEGFGELVYVVTPRGKKVLALYRSKLKKLSDIPPAQIQKLVQKYKNSPR